MENWPRLDVVVTGVGVISALGNGKANFLDGLLSGAQCFSVMQREGRQKNTAFLGAEIPALEIWDAFPKRVMRSTSLPAKAALASINEAWIDAQLAEVDPTRIGLVVGGSNFQQRDLINTQESYADRSQFLRPSYSINFMDSDVCGLCSEHFGIKGAAYTVGAASASGQMAVIRATQAVQSGEVDVCIAVGALMDLSYWECIALRGLGAMGTDRFAEQPDKACRPFDQQRDGFIFGEASAAIVVERASGITSRVNITPYAAISGWGTALDGNRNPDPSLDGEVRAIKQALSRARLAASSIDYVNPHGTASKLGDEIELEALRSCGLIEARINTTKSIIGHTLTAAGAVELVATLLQMKASALHPCLNLDDPIDTGFAWVGSTAEKYGFANAINLSYGFGGINTAVCLTKW